MRIVVIGAGEQMSSLEGFLPGLERTSQTLSQLLVYCLKPIWRTLHGKAYAFQMADVDCSLFWSAHALHRPLYCQCRTAHHRA